MIQCGKDLRLAPEAREPLGIAGQRLRQDFQRDVAIELGVMGAIHLAHAPGPDGGDDLVRTDAVSGGD